MGVSTAVGDRTTGRVLLWRTGPLALVALTWVVLFAGAYALGSSSGSGTHAAASQALASGTNVVAVDTAASQPASHVTVVGVSAVPAPAALKPKPKAAAVRRVVAVAPVHPGYVARYVAPRVTVRATPAVTPVVAVSHPSPTRSTGTGSTESGGSGTPATGSGNGQPGAGNAGHGTTGTGTTSGGG